MIELDTSTPEATPPAFGSRAWHRLLDALFGSLKVRITLAAMATLALGIGSITAALVNRAERDTLAMQRHRELGETARTATLLARHVLDLQRDLRTAANLLTAETLSSDDAVDRFVENRPMLLSRFAAVFVAAPDGRIRAMTDASGLQHPAAQLGDREYFQRLLNTERAVISKPLASRVSGDPMIVLAEPVRSGPDRVGNGSIGAVLGGTLRLAQADLISNLISSGVADAQTQMIVTDVQGFILAHPDRSRIMHSLADEPRMSAAYAAWVAQGRLLEQTGLALPQPGEVVTAAGVLGPKWVIWRVRPEAEFLEPLRAARKEAISWAAGAIALLSAAMLGLLWWLLRPLMLLERRAQNLFNSDVDHMMGWPVAGGEIGQFGRVLRHVAAERAQLEAFNTQVLRKLGSVMTAAPIGIAFTRDHRFELVSTEFCRLLGRTEDALLGVSTRIASTSDEDHARFLEQVSQAFSAGRPYVGDHPMQREDGSSFWASLRGNPVDVCDPYAGAIWTMADISDERIENQRLAWSATHDALTGLANRKLFEQRAGTIVAAGGHAVPATIVFIDLDRFKPINDTAGHAAGDAVLQAVGAALSATVRSTDLVARLGGDEFALLLEHCSHEVAWRIAENVRAAVCAVAVPWGGRVLGVGASLGIACLTPGMTRLADWVSAADAACYAAKAAGRGVVRSATKPLTEPAVEDSAAVN